MKTMLLTLCLLHLVSSKQYLVETEHLQKMKNEKEFKEQKEDSGDYHMYFPEKRTTKPPTGSQLGKYL